MQYQKLAYIAGMSRLIGSVHFIFILACSVDMLAFFSLCSFLPFFVSIMKEISDGKFVVGQCGMTMTGQKSGKAVGPHDIPVEVWKCLGETAVEFLTSKQDFQVRRCLSNEEGFSCRSLRTEVIKQLHRYQVDEPHYKAMVEGNRGEAKKESGYF